MHIKNSVVVVLYYIFLHYIFMIDCDDDYLSHTQLHREYITSSEMYSRHLTHPKWTHTRSCGQPCYSARGAVGGSVPCSKAPQSGIEGGYPPTNNPCQTWDSNPQPSAYKSNSLSIRLPLFECAFSFILYFKYFYLAFIYISVLVNFSNILFQVVAWKATLPRFYQD